MYILFPGGGTMLVLTFDILDLLLALVSLHTNIIYILYIYIINAETQRNPPKTLFPNFFATKPTQAQNELLRCCIFAS